MKTLNGKKRIKGYQQKFLSLAAGAVLGASMSMNVAADSAVGAQKMLDSKHDYMQYCSNCHGPEGRGDGPYTEMYGVYPIDLRLLALNNNGVFPTDYVRTLIDGREDIRKHGSRTMPGWFDALWSSPKGGGARQATDRINGLTDYLSRIQISIDD